MRENQPTYEELMKKIKIQEFEIGNLSRKEEFLNTFRFFVEQSNDLICEVDSDSLFRKVNPGIAHVLGYSKEELIGKSFVSFVHPDDLENLLEKFYSLTHGNTCANFENRFLNRNGEYIIVQWTAIPISSQSIYAIGRDITELRKTQAKLIHSENLLNSAQKIAKIGTWEFNLETKALAWSDGLYAIFEIEKEEGQDLFQIYLNHFSQESIDRLQKKIDQLIIDKKPFQIEQSALLVEDKIKWVNETVFPLLDEKGNVFAIRGNTQDVSLEKELNDALKGKEEAEIQNKLKQVEEESNKKFKYYIEKAPYGIFVLDEKGHYLDINPSSVNMSGYSKEELLKMKFGDLSLPEYKEKVPERFKTLLEKGSLKGETQAVRKNGEIVWRFYNIIKISENRYLGFDRDITENKIIEAKIIQNEKRFRAMLENNDAIVSLMDENRHIIFISSSAERITGWSHNELEKFFNGEYLHPDDQEEMKRVFQEMLLHPGKLFPVSFRAKHKEGHYIWFEGTINNSLNDQHIKGIVTNIRDVTERKQSEEKLNIEREKFLKIAKTSPGLIYSMRQNKDGSLSYPYASDAIEYIYGFSYAEIENDVTKIFSHIHPDDIEYVTKSIFETKTKLIPLRGTYRYFHPKKGLVWHEVNSLPEVESEGTVICHGIVTDVTDRILAEQKIIKANRIYLFISQINQMIVRTTDEETLFREACDIAVNLGKFKMAWIGLVDSHTKKVVPKMIAGDDRGYLSIIKPISYEDIPEGRGPTGTAIRKQKYICCNDIENESNMEPWRAEALSRGYLSSMSLPIIKFGKVIGVFNFYAAEKNFFDAEEIALLEEATGDVSYALENIEKESLRKKAENQVVESENRYHKLTEVSPVGIFRVDVSGQVTYVNQRWCEIAGLSYEESLGNGWLSTVHMEDSAKLFGIWKNAMSKRKTIATEYRYFRPDGTIAWVICQAVPEYNSENQFVGYVGTLTNITENKKTEEEVKKLNQKMRAVLDAIPDLLFEVGFDGKIYNYHSRQEELLVMPPNHFIGKKIEEILPKEVTEICLQAIKEASEKGFSTGAQYALELENGLHWFELSVAPMQVSDDFQAHFILLSRDITKTKNAEYIIQKSEERYRGLINNLNSAVLVQASDSSIIFYNKEAEELLLTFDKEIHKVKMDLDRVLFDDEGEILSVEKYPINLILKSKKPIKGYVIGIRRTVTNNTVWVLVNGFPVFDEKGEIIEVLFSFYDITELKNIEIELVKSKELADAANKAKTDFLANMSHEIRTPLNGIIGFTHLLMKSNMDENQQEYMTTINESASLLMHIVNDVLDFSKIESGKLELDIEEIDLFKLTKQVVDLFQFQVKEKDINFVFHMDETIPQYILADSVRLKQILVNLLSNAVKFTSFGEIRLEINQLAPIEEKWTTIKFSVKDTGIGVKEINKKEIFKSFVQEDTSTSRKFGGTGLGLTISNQLLKLMNSELQLISHYGEGSDFFFTIKFEKSNHKESIGNNLSNNLISDNQKRTSKNLENKKILIVEDNKINMLLAKKLIATIISNCTIYEAKDGNEAIEEYKKEKPDIILMDIQMPNKNGYEATSEIRKIKQSENIPIIALTAGIMEGDKEKCLQSGMNDYLSKPIDINNLEKMLGKWLN